MPFIAHKNIPIRNIRLAAGISENQMAEILSEKLARPISPAYVRTLEQRGFKMHDYVQAYADACKCETNLIAEAAKNS